MLEIRTSVAVSDDTEADTLVAALVAEETLPAPAQTDRQQVRLRDDTAVILRDAQPEDAELLRRMFYQLGDRSRYYYFFTGAPSTDAWAKRVVALGVADGRTSYALIAQVQGAAVGVARLARNRGTCSADVGVLLADAWQSRGLGTQMLFRLQREARRRMVPTITMEILGENWRAVRMARRVFPQAHIALRDGVYDVEACLSETAGTAEPCPDAW
jgi:RimJ/RimL family protein N-acetyltransferase